MRYGYVRVSSADTSGPEQPFVAQERASSLFARYPPRTVAFRSWSQCVRLNRTFFNLDIPHRSYREAVVWELGVILSPKTHSENSTQLPSANSGPFDFKRYSDPNCHSAPRSASHAAG